MNYANSKNTNINVENPTFNAKGATNSMQSYKEQQEILLQCHEEQTANEQWHISESHGMACNCAECN